MKHIRGSMPVFADPEAYWRSNGIKLIAGVDEAGRGPLAGPVVAAAVILRANTHIPGLTDSKMLASEQRLVLETTIRADALAWAVAEVGVREIERVGILKASLKAMALAVQDLALLPEMLLVDGNQPLPVVYPQQPVIDGDARCISIAAASVLAKVHRDRLMAAYHRRFPQYNFARHKGYATPEHLEALRTWGPCPLHRRTFKGVKEFFQASQEE